MADIRITALSAAVSVDINADYIHIGQPGADKKILIADFPISTPVQSALDAKQAALTFGIANTNALRIDQADAAENDLCQLTTTGVRGMSYAEVLSAIGAAASSHYHTEAIPFACSDETTALTAGTGKMTFRMPYAFTATAVRASLTTAQTSGNIFTVDINEGGTSILSTKLTIDNTEKTSTTAATAAVISDATLADDAEITVDIDQIGDGTAKGLKVYIIGHQ